MHSTTRATRTLSCLTLTTALGSRGTWRNGSTTWPMPTMPTNNGLYPRPSPDTNLLSKKKHQYFPCQLCNLSKDSHGHQSRSPTSRQGLQDSSSVRAEGHTHVNFRDACPPHTYHLGQLLLRGNGGSLLNHPILSPLISQAGKLCPPNGPHLQSTGTLLLLLVKMQLRCNEITRYFTIH